jgi:hypothetical protein
LYEKVLGFKDLEDFMVNFWEAWALSKGKSAGAPVSTSLPLRERERERERGREEEEEKPTLALSCFSPFHSDTQLTY